jgi:DNA-3-methyladenine glycosylase
VSAALGEDFFARSVHEVARDLVGCTLLVGDCGGVIVETESYHREDPACHAYVGRTARSQVLFGPPARAYVYLSYGIHSLLNAVAERDGEAAAVLIRAMEPTEGVERMRPRRRRERIEDLCSGPGKLTEALGVGLELNGASLLEEPFAVLPRSDEWSEVEVVAGPRIGISKAVDFPWRFCAAASPFVSRPRPALGVAAA